MDAPPIQDCRTDDGADIAYWALGDGPSLLYCNAPGMNHLTYEWELGPARRFYQLLAERHRLIRYNPRHCGLSGEAADLSLEGFFADITAVLDATGAGPVALIGWSSGTVLTAAFAALHPERVRALTLLQGQLQYEAHHSVGRVIGKNNPASAVELWFPDASADEQEAIVVLTDHALTDLRLVIDWPDAILRQGPELARAIPGAQLITREGRSGPWWDPDPEGLVQLIGDFVQGHSGTAPAPGPEPPSDRTLRTRETRLTPREIEVLRLIADGASNPQIAEQLVISPGTAARHVTNILNKTGCENRAEAARYAAENGLIGD